MTEDPKSAAGSFETLARNVLAIEAAAISETAVALDAEFARACDLILAGSGRVIVVGMGKSGHIAGKIAATLASTGTPAFYVHPGEASHGDLGMITPVDIVLALSHSGETEEIITLLPILKRMGVPLIAVTGNPDSTLGRQAQVVLRVVITREACPLNLAPTASTTASLAIGDALAVALLQSRGFTRDDFARSHPGGRLGRRLLVYVEDLMHSGERLPLVNEDSLVTDALLEMTGKGLGMTGVTNRGQKLCGIFTDGDLRRALNRGVDIYKARIKDVMTRTPRTTREGTLAAELVEMMRRENINGVFVVDAEQKALGALNMQDLLKAGVV